MLLLPIRNVLITPSRVIGPKSNDIRKAPAVLLAHNSAAESYTNSPSVTVRSVVDEGNYMPLWKERLIARKPSVK